ncbi:hypothetical protein L9F63_024151, partial [Diploptera punctata]
SDIRTPSNVECLIEKKCWLSHEKMEYTISYVDTVLQNSKGDRSFEQWINNVTLTEEKPSCGINGKGCESDYSFGQWLMKVSDHLKH